MRPIALCLILCTLAACAVARTSAEEVAQPEGQPLVVASGTAIGWGEMISRLEAADVVILGELHDNARHHQTQAWLVGQLRPEGLAFEMIPEASEDGIRVFLEQGGDRADIGPAIGWERLGWPDWALYRPIFTASQAKIYTGGGTGRARARKAIREGAAAVVGDERFVPTLDTNLDGPVQAAMEAEMVASHCGHLPKSAAPGMVEAQRLRDASFAAAVLRAREQSGGQVVLITGNGHARSDRGVPLYLGEVAPELSVLTVGLVESESAPSALDADGAKLPYDFVWHTRPADREDPCNVFKQ